MREIEVEVLEIDGVKQEGFDGKARGDTEARGTGRGAAWSDWQGKVKLLDRRWWPLWVILGALVAVFACIAGLLGIVIWSVSRFLRGMLRVLSGGGHRSDGTVLPGPFGK